MLHQSESPLFPFATRFFAEPSRHHDYLSADPVNCSAPSPSANTSRIQTSVHPETQSAASSPRVVPSAASVQTTVQLPASAPSTSPEATDSQDELTDSQMMDCLSPSWISYHCQGAWHRLLQSLLSDCKYNRSIYHSDLFLHWLLVC